MTDYSTAYHLLSHAFRHLMAQEVYGINDNGVCTYLNTSGNSCVMGLALRIHSSRIDLTKLSGAISTNAEYLAKVGLPWATDALELAQAAQCVHDQAARDARRAGIKAPTWSGLQFAAREQLGWAKQFGHDQKNPLAVVRMVNGLSLE